MDQVRELPAWFWLIAGLIAGAGLLAWHRFVIESGPDESWLDAGQPPLNVDAAPLMVPRARVRTWPATLREWPASLVGDC